MSKDIKLVMTISDIPMTMWNYTLTDIDEHYQLKQIIKLLNTLVGIHMIKQFLHDSFYCAYSSNTRAKKNLICTGSRKIAPYVLVQSPNAPRASSPIEELLGTPMWHHASSSAIYHIWSNVQNCLFFSLRCIEERLSSGSSLN